MDEKIIKDLDIAINDCESCGDKFNGLITPKSVAYILKLARNEISECHGTIDGLYYERQYPDD
jgi:hypothetical protein